MSANEDEIYDACITLNSGEYKILAPKHEDLEWRLPAIPEQPEPLVETPNKAVVDTQAVPLHVPTFVQDVLVKKQAREAAKEAKKKAKALEQARRKEEEERKCERSRRISRRQTTEENFRYHFPSIRLTAMKLAPTATHIRLRCEKDGDFWCATVWEGKDADGEVLGTTGKRNKCCKLLDLCLTELHTRLCNEWTSRQIKAAGLRVAEATAPPAYSARKQ